jgi:hypothetical protein
MGKKGMSKFEQKDDFGENTRNIDVKTAAGAAVMTLANGENFYIMIKMISYRTEDTNIEIKYTPDVRTYNIVSGLMTEDCKPFRVAQSAMIWIDENGYIGEIECIYPIVVEEQICTFKDKVKTFYGFPAFEILCCDNEIYIQSKGSGFVIWFSKDKEIDAVITFKQLKFLIANNELVGITCEEQNIVE